MALGALGHIVSTHVPSGTPWILTSAPVTHLSNRGDVDCLASMQMGNIWAGEQIPASAAHLHSPVSSECNGLGRGKILPQGVALDFRKS